MVQVDFIKDGMIIGFCSLLGLHHPRPYPILPPLHTTPPPHQPHDLAITVDGRRLLFPPLLSDWLGNFTLHGQISVPLSSVTPPTITNISTLALRLHERLLSLNTAYVNNLIASLGSVKDVARIAPSFIWGRTTGFGMLVASWARQGLYENEWGEEVGM